MPRPLHPGRPGSPGAIAPGWAAAHAPVVTGTLDCTVQIGPAGGTPAWNEAAGRTFAPLLAPLYDGPASVGLLSTSDGTTRTAGEDVTDERAYEIKLPAGQGIDLAPEHLVRVTDAPNPALVGEVLQVTSIAEPGREFSRVLYATATT